MTAPEKKKTWLKIIGVNTWTKSSISVTPNISPISYLNIKKIIEKIPNIRVKPFKSERK